MLLLLHIGMFLGNYCLQQLLITCKKTGSWQWPCRHTPATWRTHGLIWVASAALAWHGQGGRHAVYVGGVTGVCKFYARNLHFFLCKIISKICIYRYCENVIKAPTRWQALPYQFRTMHPIAPESSQTVKSSGGTHADPDWSQRRACKIRCSLLLATQHLNCTE